MTGRRSVRVRMVCAAALGAVLAWGAPARSATIEIAMMSVTDWMMQPVADAAVDDLFYINAACWYDADALMTEIENGYTIWYRWTIACTPDGVVLDPPGGQTAWFQSSPYPWQCCWFGPAYFETTGEKEVAVTVEAHVRDPQGRIVPGTAASDIERVWLNVFRPDVVLAGMDEPTEESRGSYAAAGMVRGVELHADGVIPPGTTLTLDCACPGDVVLRRADRRCRSRIQWGWRSFR